MVSLSVKNVGIHLSMRAMYISSYIALVVALRWELVMKTPPQIEDHTQFNEEICEVFAERLEPV